MNDWVQIFQSARTTKNKNIIQCVQVHILTYKNCYNLKALAGATVPNRNVIAQFKVS